MAKLVKVRIGETPVPSRTERGGYSPGVLVEIPDWEAAAIVEAGRGSYTSSKKEADVVHEDKTVNADKTLKTGGN